MQLSPAYAPGLSVDELAREGVIAQETARIFCRPDGTALRLYRHQEEAIRKALAGQSMVVTSGTGSGKSLCYFLPIVESLVRQPDTGDRAAALVVYPMNPLVNSQFQALTALKQRYEQALARPFPVTFAKYTGETTDADREEMRRRPPQILLTNYVMAELLLVRPEDQRFLERAVTGEQQAERGQSEPPLAARHSPEPACDSWFLTNCTPTAAGRGPTSPCSCAGSMSAAPRAPCPHRHQRRQRARGRSFMA